MLIIKGGISRDIDKKNLQQYKDKGYTVVEQENTQAEPESVDTDQTEDKKAKKAVKSGGEADGTDGTDSKA